jgi:hypothetical protein
MRMSGQLHVLATLHPFPIEWRFGGRNNRDGRLGEKEKPLPLPGIEPRFLGRPARSLITLTKPTRLPFVV